MLTDQAMLLAGAVGLAGVVSIVWVTRQPTKLRLIVGGLYLLLYSFVLWRGDIAPLRPPPAAIQGGYRLAAQLLELFWWYCLARYAIGLGRAFLLIHHRPEEQKFATDLLAGFVYVCLIFSVAGLVFGLPITGLVATSGVIAIVLGLALQSTLSDLFSGIALNIEGPYQVGDWVQFEGGVEGQVIEINWRATHVMTATRESVAVPNSAVAKSRIVNFSSPSQTQGVEVSISLDNRTPPAQGVELLEHAVLNCLSVLRDPPPKIRVKGFGASSVAYQVRFFVASVDFAGDARSNVLNSIYRHAAWTGVGIAVPDAGAEPVLRIGPGGARPQVASLVERAPLLARLPPQERDALQKVLLPHVVKPGELLMRQGSEVSSLYFIESGVFSLTRDQQDGTVVEVDRRGPGDDFGAYATISGKPATITASALTSGSVLELRKADLSALIEAWSGLKTHLESTLATRVELAKIGVDVERADLASAPSMVTRFFRRLESILPPRDGGPPDPAAR